MKYTFKVYNKYDKTYSYPSKRGNIKNWGYPFLCGHTKKTNDAIYISLQEIRFLRKISKVTGFYHLDVADFNIINKD